MTLQHGCVSLLDFALNSIGIPGTKTKYSIKMLLLSATLRILRGRGLQVLVLDTYWCVGRPVRLSKNFEGVRGV